MSAGKVREPLLAFVSYAREDGTEFVDELVARLMKFDPPCEAFIDRDQPADRAFTEIVDQALLGCNVVLYVMTRKAETRKWCGIELLRADRFDKPVLPLRLDADALLPSTLESRDEVNFVQGATDPWEELARRLDLLRAPTVEIERLTREIGKLREQGKNETGQARRRIDARIGRLLTHVQNARRRLGDPGERLRVKQGIELALADRLDVDVPRHDGPVRVIGALPPRPLAGFHDRYADTAELVRLLSDPKSPLVVMVGDVGAGKTAMTFKLIDQAKERPDRLAITAMVYLSSRGLRSITTLNVLQHLARVPSDPARAEQLGRTALSPASSWLQRLRKILDEIRDVRVLLVIDHAEEIIDQETRGLRDKQLGQMFHELADYGRGDIKVLLFAARPAPRPRELPARSASYELGKGLQFPHSMDFFADLDHDHVFQDELADDGIRDRLQKRTEGNPRLLELVFAVLQGEPTLTLSALLDELWRVKKSQNLSEVLLIRAMSSLDLWTWRALVALAIFGRPVRAEAVNFLLTPFIDGYDSKPDLEELHQRRFIRRDGIHYFVPPDVERECVINSVPFSDRDPIAAETFNRRTLFALAADYFEEWAPDEVDRPDDLGPQLAEIQMRLRAGQYDTAFEVLSDIDREHLSRWGLSGILLPWRKELHPKLSDQNLVFNLSGSANACIQLGQPNEAVKYVEEALKLATAAGDREKSVRLIIQLAKVNFGQRHLDEAQRLYQRANAAAEEGGHRACLAMSLNGAGLCLAEMGQLNAAFEHYGKAFAISRQFRGEAKLEHARLLLNMGDCHALVGRTPEALEAIRTARRLAEGMNPALEAKCQDAEAYVLIDDGRLRAAIKLAEQAAEFAARTDSDELSRAVGNTLAIVHLCAGELEKAKDAADSAAKYFEKQDPVASPVLQGIMALRYLHDEHAARTAFNQACEAAQGLLRRQRNNFMVLDWSGLAWCGLAACSRDESVAAYANKAVRAYQAARRLAPEGVGAARRAQRLVEELITGSENDILHMMERVIAAAGGRRPLGALLTG